LAVAVGAIQRVIEQLSALLSEILAGQFLMTGLIVSLKHGLITIIAKAHKAELVLASLAK
jgi:hypothetical protein